MSIIPKLASSLNRRDEVPNQELAKEIVDKKDQKAVREVVDNLSNKSRDIQFDCIKVLYEIGELNPSLIADYTKDILGLLDSKNNRMQWGAMHALNTITLENPKVIYASLGKLLEAADKGSVITKDHAVNILVKLGSLKQYTEDVFPLLIEQLMSSPVNQFPSYAEKAVPLINDQKKSVFIKTLSSRLNDIEQESKRKRVEKVIGKFSK
jgi:hypothetical protein